MNTGFGVPVKQTRNRSALVDASYGHYVERIGFPPRPMLDDYTQVIRKNRVTVAETHSTIVGEIVLNDDDEGFFIDNVAVHPSCRGRGVGRSLLEFAEAEARRAGFDSIYLYTHEKMTETSPSTHAMDTRNTIDATKRASLSSI
jgi:ribosomal protein S18 acetylase RimI-like enzyme